MNEQDERVTGIVKVQLGTVWYVFFILGAAFVVAIWVLSHRLDSHIEDLRRRVSHLEQSK